MSEKLSTLKPAEIEDNDSNNNELFRPIHYLGSKLRILDFIEKTINNIDPNGGRVYDLFSGSGSVSFKLSKSRPVTAVDIQNYSKTICSALLKPVTINEEEIDNFLNGCINSEHSVNLLSSIEHIGKYEQACIFDAVNGKELNKLCQILEEGSIISYEINKNDSHISSLIKRTLDLLLEKEITQKQSLVIRYFGGIYFSYLQAAQIDAILEQIEHIPKSFKNTFKAALLSTVSECVNTVGKQFAQPIRPRKSDGTVKHSIGKMVNKDRSLNIFEVFEKWINKYKNISTLIQTSKNEILKLDFKEALKRMPDDTRVVYADPPYTRDHYSRFYHVLETISLRDTPEISTMKLGGKIILSRGLYREDRHQSPFCIRSQALSAFDEMFSIVSSKNIKLVLSYSPYDESKKSHPRVVTMDNLTDLAKKYFSLVKIESPGNFIHSKLNNSSKHLDASSNAEVLIVCS